MTRAIPNAESTSYPLWIICRVLPGARIQWLAGPWFARAAAERVLEDRRYFYGPHAEVYCCSGHASDDWRHLCETGTLPPKDTP